MMRLSHEPGISLLTPDALQLAAALSAGRFVVWLHDFPIPGRVNYPLLWD
jgi:hypothetical protein